MMRLQSITCNTIGLMGNSEVKHQPVNCKYVRHTFCADH